MAILKGLKLPNSDTIYSIPYIDDQHSNNNSLYSSEKVDTKVAEAITTAENNAVGVSIGTAPPSNHKILWVDTRNSNDAGLKYFDETQNQWIHVPVAYT